VAALGAVCAAPLAGKAEPKGVHRAERAARRALDLSPDREALSVPGPSPSSTVITARRRTAARAIARQPSAAECTYLAICCRISPARRSSGRRSGAAWIELADRPILEVSFVMARRYDEALARLDAIVEDAPFVKGT
jgi:hypothetical protein